MVKIVHSVIIMPKGKTSSSGVALATSLGNNRVMEWKEEEREVDLLFIAFLLGGGGEHGN